MDLFSMRFMLLCLLSAAVAGCARGHYRLRADRDTYSLINEKTACAPWEPSRFTIDVDRRSRLFDRSPKDDPALPIPAPQLYAYRLPNISPRDPERFRRPAVNEIPRVQPTDAASVQNASFQYEMFRLPFGPLEDARDQIQLAHFVATQQTGVSHAHYSQPGVVPPVPSSSGSATLIREPDSYESMPIPVTADDEFAVSGVVAIPPSVWDDIPRSCLNRMFEFESIREEYKRSYGLEPSADQRDASERLALEDLLELSLINSREYQTQKEQLYRASLQLSFERYEYQLKFSPSGNGIDVNWQHARNGGITENTLGLPSSAAVEKILATGGTFLARFANDIILTFNGPSGWAVDVGSEIFVEFNQRLLQRDIVFENLTQAERNVVYAARDYARFRKTFFRDIAADYYGLILEFREIEIAAQQFFSNQRNFEEGQAKYLSDQLDRTQVDLIEQDALRNRSSLIGSCNGLEQSFDQLKLRIGIPPETPINLDLRELEQLTARDEAIVAAELVRRARRNLDTARRGQAPDQVALINPATNLARHVLDLLALQESLGNETTDPQTVRELYNQLRVEETLLVVQETRAYLRAEESERPDALRILYVRIDLIEALLMLGNRRLITDAKHASDDAQLKELAKELETIREPVDNIEQNLERIPELVRSSELLLGRVDALIGDEAGRGQTPSPQELIDAIVTISQRLTTDDTGGLTPIDIPVDDAMLAALVNRFDLMNARGDLADSWRQIKLAGDDLRSVLNLRASQSIRTRSGVNRPFDFTFDDSTTSLGLTFDAPLNRRAQRNDYRVSLINYHAVMRSLMEQEDRIKVDVRNDLRALQLDQDQYAIAVASAALANQRVETTRLELRLGIGRSSGGGGGGTTTRDVVESQQAYSESLFAVAGRHITYILNRINLFLDLELLEVDDAGLWPQLYDETYQPTPRLQPPAYSGPAYGCLPRVHYSHSIRDMDRIPFGSPVVFDSDPSQRE